MGTPPKAGVLDEPDSAKTAQRISDTGPPGGWTQFQSIDLRACTATHLSGIS
jgi:hypothetical protein